MVANGVIAHTLHWLSVLLEIDESEPSKVRAYREAAAVLRKLEKPIAEVVRRGGATGLEQLGLDPRVAEVVTDWVRTGELPPLEDKKTHPLWPALTKALCRTLGIAPRPSPPRPSAPRPSRPPHRAVWESWSS